MPIDRTDSEIAKTLYRAAKVVDGDAVHAIPGALLMEGRNVIAAGTVNAIGEPSDAVVVDLPNDVLTPGLVNAHAHLDLTHIGRQPHINDFTAFARLVKDERKTDESDLAAAVELGVELSLKGGTAIIGDIAGEGRCEPIETLRRSSLMGVSYIEVFGQGDRQTHAIEQMSTAVEAIPKAAHGVRLGLQPHAPYSCGPDVYRVAACMGCPASTHLAESLEELQFVGDGTGPIAGLLEEIGVRDAHFTGFGRHPIDVLGDVLCSAPWLVAHVNYIEPKHLEMLWSWQVSVAYCPRSSSYFGHPQAGAPDHQYRAMLSAGINVALGTDSIICLDTPDRISVLDEMRLLANRDGVDGRMLLRMATINGALGLGMEPDLVTFSPGPIAGVLALPIDSESDVNPLKQALLRDDAPTWILAPQC